MKNQTKTQKTDLNDLYSALNDIAMELSTVAPQRECSFTGMSLIDTQIEIGFQLSRIADALQSKSEVSISKEELEAIAGGEI